MKITALCVAIFIAAFLVCGCTQQQASVPGTPTPSPSPATPHLTAKPIPTVSSTPFQMPTLERTPSVSDNTVNIKGNSFDPNVISINAGATVRWVNNDDTTQRLRFADGTVSQLFSTGQSWSRRFNDNGVYQYSSSVIPSMQGTVKVV